VVTAVASAPLAGHVRSHAGELGAMAAVAAISWAIHRCGPPWPLPTQTLALGVLVGHLLARWTTLQAWRPAAEVPLTLGMVLLGTQVDGGAVLAVGWFGLLLVIGHPLLAGALVRGALVRVGVPRATASVVGIGLGGSGLPGVVAAQAAEARPDDEARALAVTATLAVGALGFVLLPWCADRLGLDAAARARWIGIAMPTTAEAVLLGAAHSPAALRATAALRFLVTLMLWLPVLLHLRRVGEAGADVNGAAQRRHAVAAALARVPGFVFGLALLAALTMAGGLDDDERRGLARLANWAFLTALAGIGMGLRAAALRRTGVDRLLAAIAGWLAAAAALALVQWAAAWPA
jgi:uncharacterized membrane protein YadS